MQSTLTARETDPHDIFVIEPDVVLAARADQAPVEDALSRLAASRSHVAPDTASPPPVEPTFRAAAIDDIQLDDLKLNNLKLDEIKIDKILGERPPTARWVRRAVMALLALCSAVAAAAWQHYGDDARQMLASFAPPFAFASSPPAEKSPLTEPSNASAIQATAADQATAPPAASAQPADSTAPVVTASSADSTPLLQSMARDLATMGQQIEQLKAEIQELRAGQAPISRDATRTSEIKPSDVKPPELRPAVPNPRPRISALSPPPRPAAAPVRKPRPAFSPAPAAATPALPPVAATPAPPQPAPQVTTTAQDDEPVIRPPMPVR